MQRGLIVVACFRWRDNVGAAVFLSAVFSSSTAADLNVGLQFRNRISELDIVGCDSNRESDSRSGYDLRPFRAKMEICAW